MEDVSELAELPSPEQVTAEGRARRLDWALGAVALVCSGLLTTLALPWAVITTPGGTMELPDGSETMLTAATTTLPGRMSGATTPVLVAVAVGVVTVVAARRRAWFVPLVPLLVLVQQGVAVKMPGPRGAIDAPAPGIGFQLTSVLYPALLLLVAVVAVQTFMVRKAEHAASGEDTAGASLPLGGLLARVLGAAVDEARRPAAPAPAPADTAVVPVPAPADDSVPTTGTATAGA